MKKNLQENFNANANGSSVLPIPDLLFASPSDDEDEPSGDDGQVQDQLVEEIKASSTKNGKSNSDGLGDEGLGYNMVKSCGS